MKGVEILCIDDNRMHLEVISTVIELSGYTIHSTTSVYEAYELLNKYPIDAIVTDYQMPGCDGIDFAKLVRKNSFSGLIVILTSDHEVLDRIDSLSGDIQLLLKDGSYTDELRSYINNYCEKKVTTATS